MFVKLTATQSDGTTIEYDPASIVIQPTAKTALRELAVMDQIAQMLQGLNTNERKRIIAWLADRNVNVGVD